MDVSQEIRRFGEFYPLYLQASFASGGGRITTPVLHVSLLLAPVE